MQTTKFMKTIIIATVITYAKHAFARPPYIIYRSRHKKAKNLKTSKFAQKIIEKRNHFSQNS